MLQPQPTDQGIIETSHSGLRILKGGGMDHLRGETLRNSLGQVWWRRGDAHERWGILLPRLSQFPIPYVPGWMRVTSLISVHSALTTPNSRRQESMRPLDKVTFPHSVSPGHSAWGVGRIGYAFLCFSPSRRGKGYISEFECQNQCANPRQYMSPSLP